MMKRFTTPIAFRQALEERLKKIATERNTPLQELRLKVAIERLLARLFSTLNPPWLLKGGYAMELRYRPSARATRDIDLTMHSRILSESSSKLLEKIHEELMTALDGEFDDFFTFRIEKARVQLQGAPYGGASFPVQAQIAGREYIRFSIDVGVGDPVLDPPEELFGEPLLEFAGISAVRALAISIDQQFAEKIHAYTYPWEGRINTRTKDLIDLILLIERGSLSVDRVQRAVEETFRRRASHAVPSKLPSPPIEWADDFAKLCLEVGLSRTLGEAFEQVASFWETVQE